MNEEKDKLKVKEFNEFINNLEGEEVKKFYKEFESVITKKFNKWPTPIMKCKKCKHKWVPRKPEVPAECPKCKSARWNR